ncbi:M56 family metallopeptidase [Perlabentimonas gracilis]|uniref:M56 family metallopeptidase n=1 Tax=Perlabentimonas gracilis TaxID=2715279 RepID=UPI001407F622|nr:M56 family metallopeptidase [Perlabentimonas gracilis]NHB67339.1 M56 family metallopeptidase [Perlabentimonas gracilis]
MEASSTLSILLKISLGIFIFWGIWFLFLRNVNRFGLVRGFILLGVITSAAGPWLLPAIQSIFQISPLPSYGMVTISIPEVTIGPSENSINWNSIFSIAILSISALFVLRLAYQLIKIGILTQQGKRYRKGSMLIVEHENDTPPFSFMKYCFINPQGIPQDGLEDILKHEQAHQQKGHSFDIMLFEVVGIVQWFNPFYWMLRKAIVEVHEYQADKAVIDTQTDPHAYLDTIISIAFSGIALPIGNNFNKSLTLKRLAMMNITQKTKGALLRWALALAVAIPAAFIISCDSNEIAETEVKEEITVELIANDDEISKTSEAEGEIFVVVEKMPRFQGGDINKFLEYISKNLQYPEIAADNGIQGRVIMSFIIEPDGRLTNAKILRGADPSLDKEALRVVESSPVWTPGTQRDEPVRVSFNIPILFTLE